MSFEEVVDRETATKDFERFLELMDLDIAKAIARADGKKEKDTEENHIVAARETVITAIMRGLASVDDEGQLVYTPLLIKKDPITFREPTGATYSAGKGKTGSDGLNATMANMTGEIPARFASMKKRDLTVCHAIASIFLA